MRLDMLYLYQQKGDKPPLEKRPEQVDKLCKNKMNTTKVVKQGLINGKAYSVRSFYYVAISIFEDEQPRTDYTATFDDDFNNQKSLLQHIGNGSTIDQAVEDLIENYDKQVESEGLKEGVKETKLNYLVDLDVYSGRVRYYSGTRYDQVLAVNKEIYPDLLKSGYTIKYHKNAFHIFPP